MSNTLRLMWLIPLLAAAGCAKRGDAPAAPTNTRAAVRIGDEVITVAEIDRYIGLELFDMRSAGLRAVLVERLARREADKRHVTMEQLRQQEIESKVPMPTDEEGVAALKEWVDGRRLTPAEATKMSPAMAADRLRALRLNEAEEAFYDRLMHDNAVKIDFDALGKPALEVAMDGPTLGPANAPIKIVEFADLSLSFTSMWQATLEKLVEKYPTRVQLRFKQKPSSPDGDGVKLAEGALCAADQGRYWDLRKALFKNKVAPTAAALTTAAADAKLDLPAFERCLASGAKKVAVAANVREAERNRLDGEPVLSLNGIVVTGAQDLATIERYLRIETNTL
jgi:protein-disulfide isomerase